MTIDAPPVVLVFAGSDPTGGAGIAADILTLASLGCHPAPVVTAVTAQDTADVKQFTPVDTGLVIAQARAILEDMPVAAIKTGMLGNPEILAAVATIAGQYAQLPLVVDPVLASAAGNPLAEGPMEDALRSLLVPRATLITPNTLEARALAPGADTVDACAQELLDLGSGYVLVTGTHENTPEVSHRLYTDRRLVETFSVERLPAQYHGSGCTLAAACAAALAHGIGLPEGINRALNYTWQSLRHGYRLGMGQHLPNRLYWTDASTIAPPKKRR